MSCPSEYFRTDGLFLAYAFVHGNIAVMYGYGLYGFHRLDRRFSTGSPEEFGGLLKYLTWWNMFFQFIYFVLSFVIDLSISLCHPHNLLSIRDYFFAGIVFPLAVFVFLMFWGIYVFNRDVILPREHEANFPAWLNHLSHTAVLPVILLETFIVQHRYPGTLKGFAATLVFGSIYLACVIGLGIARDIWVYIFLKDFNHLGKAVFFLVSFAIAFLIYYAGENINYYFWRFYLRLPISGMKNPC